MCCKCEIWAGDNFSKTLYLGKKVTTLYCYQACFHELQSTEIRFSMSGPFFLCSLIKCFAFFILKNYKKPYV